MRLPQFQSFALCFAFKSSLYHRLCYRCFPFLSFPHLLLCCPCKYAFKNVTRHRMFMICSRRQQQCVCGSREWQGRRKKLSKQLGENTGKCTNAYAHANSLPCQAPTIGSTNGRTRFYLFMCVFLFFSSFLYCSATCLCVVLVLQRFHQVVTDSAF